MIQVGHQLLPGFKGWARENKPHAGDKLFTDFVCTFHTRHWIDGALTQDKLSWMYLVRVAQGKRPKDYKDEKEIRHD